MTLNIIITEADSEDGTLVLQVPDRHTRTNRHLLIALSLLVIFATPIILVLSLDLPLFRSGDKESQIGGTNNAAVVPNWQSATIPTISTDKLVNARELSLNTTFNVSNIPTIRDFEFHISQGYGAPDGFQKLMILVNGQSPGPLIEANVGDTVRISVHNELKNMSTSIHWHGIDQRNTTWMDGVTGVSQCGIPPGESFTYEFQLSDQRGTFWYHAHTMLQYTDGLYGPIVVHDPNEMVPDVDDDQIVFIGDHYHTDSSTLRESYLQPYSRWSPDIPGVEPLPDNFLINGRHTYDCTVNSTTWPASSSNPCTGGQLSVVRVSPNQTTRLRIINHSTFFSFWFSIDNHTLTIVEIDGVEVTPIADQRGVYLNLGQRYSVLVHGGAGGGTYAMRATLPQTCFVPYCPYASSGLESIGYEATALFTYSDAVAQQQAQQADVVLAGSKGNTSNPFGVENNFLRGDVWEGCDDMPFDTPVPVRKRPAAAVGANNAHEVTFRFQEVGEVNRIFINRTSWSPYKNDATIWKVLNDSFLPGQGGSYSNFGLRLDQQILLAPDANEGVQIAINSRDMMEHPFHLHGHSFQIVGWGSGEFEGGSSGRTTWNLDNPMRRDTVTIPAQWHVVLRFAADNPGIWALHCHVGWHMEGGMFVSLLERPEDLKALVAGMDREMWNTTQSFCHHGTTP